MTRDHGITWRDTRLTDGARLTLAVAEIVRMRARIESLRGLCKTAVGYLRDEHADSAANQIARLIGDMEDSL